MDTHTVQLLGELGLFIALTLLAVAVFWQTCRRRPEPEIVQAPPTQRLAADTAQQVLVQDIMTRDLATLAPNDNAKRAWRRLQEHKVKTLPVVEHGRVVGIIALVDFLKHLGLAWRTLPEDLDHRANIVMDLDVATLMSKPVRTVRADMPLIELVPMLSDSGLRHIPVVNELGMLVGIVTQSDLIAGLAHLLAAQK